jgi:peptidoglycan/xylan/chitin deacetylase (PgdA/CDA1 family)
MFLEMMGMKSMNRTILTGILIFIAGLSLGLAVSKIPNRLAPQAQLPKTKTSDGSEYSNRQPMVTDLVKLFPKTVKRQGSSKTAYLALTFDDGPDRRYTPQILDTLKKLNVRATFFVVGTQIQKYPDVFKRMVREGHEIATHGFHHLKISELPPAQIQSELAETNQLITRMGGPQQTLYRPPYGAIDPAAVKIIAAKNYKIVLWTIDSLDWRSLKQSQVIDNVVPKFQRGYIVLQHCAAESKKESLDGSVQALPTLIDAAMKANFKFCTISQLLK